MTLLSDALVARLREWGVHRVFGYAGDGIDPLLAALHRAGGDPELVTTRHEEMAAFMASGHARYTGEVAVTDASTPMLAPLQPQEKVDQMLAGIEQEPGGEAVAERVRAQRAREA